MISGKFEAFLSPADNLCKQFDQYNSKKGCKDQESIQTSTTPEPGYQWESDNIAAIHHIREPRGQQFPIK